MTETFKEYVLNCVESFTDVHDKDLATSERRLKLAEKHLSEFIERPNHKVLYDFWASNHQAEIESAIKRHTANKAVYEEMLAKVHSLTIPQTHKAFFELVAEQLQDEIDQYNSSLEHCANIAQFPNFEDWVRREIDIKKSAVEILKKEIERIKSYNEWFSLLGNLLGT